MKSSEEYKINMEKSSENVPSILSRDLLMKNTYGTADFTAMTSQQ